MLAVAVVAVEESLVVVSVVEDSNHIVRQEAHAEELAEHIEVVERTAVEAVAHIVMELAEGVVEVEVDVDVEVE